LHPILSFMKFSTRKLIKPEDLNANNTLFGGQLLKWIDEEAGIYAMTKLASAKVVTKFMSEINFVSSAAQADVIEIGLEFISVGRSSISFRCEVRNLFTKKTIISIEKIVFVNVDEHLKPTAHGKTFETIFSESVL
jgi:acyl-CoA thioesterase YciA